MATVYRCILPQWAAEKYPKKPRVVEGEFTQEQVEQFNAEFYNIYFLPNSPSCYDSSRIVDGSQIDTFSFVFVDMDLKEEVYKTKDEFIAVITGSGIDPTFIVDSGNGVHVYWAVNDLDAMSYLKLQRRLMRKFKTDEAVAKIYQLMRVPQTTNTKLEGEFKQCDIIYQTNNSYACEDLDKLLPPLTREDDNYCHQHHDKTYNLNQDTAAVSEQLPLKFAKLLHSNEEVKKLWASPTDDRSKSDYRLGHVMFANGLTRDEALSVLINTAKALERAPIHRVSYATNIVDQIWTYELTEDKNALTLSSSVKEILNKHGSAIKGTRFACWPYLDATHHGFRLGQVIGLVAGVGVGKTTMTLNMFMGFVQNNPDYDHFFIPLEQPANEIAGRWKTMCGDNEQLHDKVHIISNYADDGTYRHLSLTEIKDYLLKFQEVTKRKVGCVVIDHIGVLKKKGKDGENHGLMEICHEMKAFAVQTNTLLIMQSQASREKAGIGDLEINKDAAYGTMYFEAYCDYLITIWQPLKRCYSAENCPTILAFKFCKIRHKKKGADSIEEDASYKLYFDPEDEKLRELTQIEEERFTYFDNQARNKRKADRKTDVLPYSSITWTKGA